MKVYKEWLCDTDNKIVFKPLSYWVEFFDLRPLEGEQYKYYWKANANGKGVRFRTATIIENRSGYGISRDEYEAYKDELFFVANADLDTPKLRQKQ